MEQYFLGVDIGGTFIKIGIVTSDGKVVKRDKLVSTNNLGDIISKIKRYLNQQVEAKSIQGVGISLPGVISNDGTMQTAGSLKELIGKNVKQIVCDSLNLPVEIITDSKAVALAENWKGAGMPFKNFVCVTLGSAVGGAIVIDNQLYWGLGGLAGEFGVSLMDRQDVNYKLDSTSLHAGVVGGLCRKYSLATKTEINDAEVIFNLADKGDLLANKFVDEFYDDVSRLLVNISVIVAPEAILIGGGVSANSMVLNKIQESFHMIKKRYPVLSLLQTPEILPCKFANDAGLIGAVKLVMDVTD